jgi:hypothetical protein
MTEQFRAVKDKEHTDIINNIRNPKIANPIDDSVVDHLKVLTPQDVIDDDSWADATIVVTDNFQRHALTAELGRRTARRAGQPVFRWKKPLLGSHCKNLSVEKESKIYDMKPQLYGYFYKGAPCFLTERNINPTKGLANGTSCTMDSIKLSRDDEYSVY